MNEIILNIISIIVTAVVIPLISIAGTQFIKFINKKIKNQEAAELLTNASTIVINAVRSVFQTYVESLKLEGKFDAQSQEKALSKAKEVALAQLSLETKKFIEDNFGSIDLWLTTQIEASINILKNR